MQSIVDSEHRRTHFTGADGAGVLDGCRDESGKTTTMDHLQHKKTSEISKCLATGYLKRIVWTPNILNINLFEKRRQKEK